MLPKVNQEPLLILLQASLNIISSGQKGVFVSKEHVAQASQTEANPCSPHRGGRRGSKAECCPLTSVNAQTCPTQTSRFLSHSLSLLSLFILSHSFFLSFVSISLTVSVTLSVSLSLTDTQEHYIDVLIFKNPYTVWNHSEL